MKACAYGASFQRGEDIGPISHAEKDLCTFFLSVSPSKTALNEYSHSSCGNMIYQAMIPRVGRNSGTAFTWPPIIHQVYHPDRGWRRYSYNKRISGAGAGGDHTRSDY